MSPSIKGGALDLAKVTRPVPEGIVSRKRLFTSLDKGRAVWVTGPPGSGKTALISS